MYGTTGSCCFTGPGFGAPALGTRPTAYGRGNYGAYSGASRDEANLVRLGGFGPGGTGSAGRTSAAAT